MIAASDVSSSNGARSSRGRAMVFAVDVSSTNGALP